MTDSPPRRLFATPAGLRLCAVPEVGDGAAKGFVIRLDGGEFRGFVLRKGSEVFGYVDACPHAGLSLAETPDEYLTPQGDFILCAQHGALFRPETGLCVGGPCAGRSLTRWPVRIADGFIEAV